MKILTFLLLAVLIFGVFGTHRSVRRAETPQERTLAIRVAAVGWLFGFLFLLGLFFLPNKLRVVMLLPAFFLGVSIAKAWRDSRARLRRELAGRVEFDRMKRVHVTDDSSLR